ncbi:MAG: ArnT family glycosyltransferase [Sphingomonadaceae bacterium]
MPFVVVAASSLSGALIFPLSDLGRAAPWSVSRQWLLQLLEAWFALTGWAMLYALLLHKLSAVRWRRSFYCAALGHLPLLLCIALVGAVYGSDLSNHIYTTSPYGELIFQPLAKGYILLAPATLQALLFVRCRRSRVAPALIIALITILALSLRLWNINWGLPALFHPDEHQYIGRAFLMMATGDANPRYFENPSLMIYVTDLFYLLFSQQAQAFHLLGDLLGLGIQDPRGDYLVVLAARSFSALAGALTVALVYQIGKELFDAKAGIYASCLLGVSLLHVRNSHYATNDILAVLLLTASLLFSVRIYTRGAAIEYLLAGLCGGLGVSAKYNVGFFFVAIVVAHLARALSSSQTKHLQRPHILLALGGAASAVGFVLGTPYSVLDFPSFLAGFLSQYGLGAENWLGQQAQPTPILFLSTLLHGLGLLPMVFAGTGIVLALQRDRWRLALLLSTPLAYFSFMSTQRLFFARFAMPLLPYLALLAGYGLYRLTERSHAPLWQRALPLLLLVLGVAQQLTLSWQHNYLLGQKDTRSLAAAWIGANTPEGSSIAMDGYSQEDNKFRWSSYSSRDTWVYWPGNDSTRPHIVSGDFDYVVIGSFGYGPWLLEGADPSLLPPEYRILESEAELIAVFGPGLGGADLHYSQDDMYTPYWHLTDRERPGPTIRIYDTKRLRTGQKSEKSI